MTGWQNRSHRVGIRNTDSHDKVCAVRTVVLYQTHWLVVSKRCHHKIRYDDYQTPRFKPGHLPYSGRRGIFFDLVWNLQRRLIRYRASNNCLQLRPDDRAEFYLLEGMEYATLYARIRPCDASRLPETAFTIRHDIGSGEACHQSCPSLRVFASLQVPAVHEVFGACDKHDNHRPNEDNVVKLVAKGCDGPYI